MAATTFTAAVVIVLTSFLVATAIVRRRARPEASWELVIQRTSRATAAAYEGKQVSMWFRRHKQSPPPASEPLESRDQRAYVALEEARLRCEKLRAHASTRAQQDGLHRLHRELGLAGLLASSNIPARVRLALLSDAHERCTRPVFDADDELQDVTLLINRAEQCVGLGFDCLDLSDPMRLAHVHLLRGREVLDVHRAGVAPRSEATTRVGDS